MPELLGRLQSALADRYRLEREIGAGGMATVYLAGWRSSCFGPSSPP
jgi:serine/threonine protein kinase